MEKGLYLKDIVPNTPVKGVFAVHGAARATTKKGDPYWRLKLSDATGQVEAKIWHPLSAAIRELADGLIVRVSGMSSLYQNSPQISIERLTPLDQAELASIDPGDFMSASPYDIEKMFADLLALCDREFTYPKWRKLVFSILEHPRIAEDFKKCPAAKHIHHAYAGGLLEHTLSVFRLCLHIADHYGEEIDRQTLLAGALFHDLGKIRELSSGISVDYSDEGRLFGHIFLALEIMEPFFASSGLDKPLKDHLRHLVLSHHGELQFGAARLPQTAEAFALHYADNLDAKLAQCRAALNVLAGGENRWSEWQRALERHIYRPWHTPACSENHL